jgi:transposase
MKSNDGRSLSPAAQAAVRLRAVAAVEAGMKQTDAAKVFGVSRAAVAKWMSRLRKRGAAALRTDGRGRPKGTSLSPKESTLVVRLVKGKCPDQLCLPYALWTREAVGQLIEARLGKKLSVWTVGRHLRNWGFTPQKPARRAMEQNPEAVRRWLEEEYPTIRVQARKSGAEIHWGDEMGLRSDCQVGRTWGVRGQTPIVPGTGQRFGCSMISSITNRGALRFMVFDGTFNADLFIEFLRRLLRATERPVFLIVDGHRVHKAEKVRRWAAKHKRRLRLFFLPPYSPDLNPDEMLNNDVKANSVGRRRARNKGELLTNLRAYLRSTQKQPSVVKHFFQAKTVKYAAA